MTTAVVAPIKGAFKAATREVGRGFGSVRDALANPPKLVSRSKRIEGVTANLRKVMANLRKAVQAEDPVNIRYWDAARAKLATRLDQLKGKQDTTWAEIKQTYKRAGINIDGTWQKIKTTTDQKSSQAQDAAVTAAQGTKTGIDAVDLTSSGTAMMDELASGIRAGIPNVAAASNEAANAAAGPLRAYSPPKMGPLKDIDKWGKPLVDAWIGPMERQTGRVAQVGARLAGALSPRASLGGGAALAGAGGWGGGVTIQAGVLVADDRGIDALDRKMRKRSRIRSRGSTRYNDPR
jgi:hypothetical protein